MQTERMPQRTAEQIAFENDLFRKRTPGIAGKIYFSEAVSEWFAGFENHVTVRERLLQALGNVTEFPGGDDPYGERDFGKLEFEGEKFLFKIDYGSPVDGSYQDPYEMVPYRILTVMFVGDY